MINSHFIITFSASKVAYPPVIFPKKEKPVLTAVPEAVHKTSSKKNLSAPNSPARNLPGPNPPAPNPVA